MDREKCDIYISTEAVQRMPGYLTILREKHEAGFEYVASNCIAQKLGLNPIVVKKDLSAVSSEGGKPKLGFNVEKLIQDIKNFLNYDVTTSAVLVGAGQLGKTLLSYDGFARRGLNIVAAFDTDKKAAGTFVNGKPILGLERFDGLVKRVKPQIGIITVPKQFAQEICDRMVAAGIKGIWNFASTVHLEVPDGVAVKDEDMAASLAVLSNMMSKVRD